MKPPSNVSVLGTRLFRVVSASDVPLWEHPDWNVSLKHALRLCVSLESNFRKNVEQKIQFLLLRNSGARLFWTPLALCHIFVWRTFDVSYQFICLVSVVTETERKSVAVMDTLPSFSLTPVLHNLCHVVFFFEIIDSSTRSSFLDVDNLSFVTVSRDQA